MRIQAENTTTSVLISGFGEAGSRIHWPACMRLPQAKVVAIVEPERSRIKSELITQVPIYGDFREALSLSKPDLVIVASPPEFHAEQTILALNANAHVLCEKPISTSVCQAQAMISTASACGRVLGVNHEFRFMPIYESIFRNVQKNANDLKYAAAWQNVHLPPEVQSGWRSRYRNQILFDAGIHLIDFLLEVYQESPGAVFASITLSPEGKEHIIDAILEFSGGRLGRVSISRITRGRPEYFETRVETSKCTYRASFGGAANIVVGFDHEARPRFRINWGRSGYAWSESAGRREVVARNPSRPNIMATSAVLERTLAAINFDSINPSPPQKALEALRTVAACYLSAKEGRKIDMNGADRASVDAYDILQDRSPADLGGK